MLQIQGEFIVRWYWLSSEANELADHLSRGRIAEFAAALMGAAFLLANAKLKWAKDAGRVRQLDPLNPVDQVAMAKLVPHAKERRDMYEYARQTRAEVRLQAAAKGMLVRRALLAEARDFASAYPHIRAADTKRLPSFGSTRARLHFSPVTAAVRCIFFFFCVAANVQDVACMPRVSRDVAIMYPRTDIYYGLAHHVLTRVDQLMDNSRG